MKKDKWPDHWEVADLESIVDVMKNGANLKQLSEQNEGYLPITRIETIANEYIDLERVKYVETSPEIEEKYLVLKGDILFSHINSDKHLGKTAIYDGSDKLIHGINLLLIRANERIQKPLLNYLFKYYRNKGEFIKVAQRAVNQSSINQKKLKSITIPIPPLPEQKQIVAKLDALFGHLEQVRERLDRIPELLKNFRQSVLTQAVTGKLTEEWRERRNLENSIGIFKNIEKRRSDNKKKKIRDKRIEVRSDLDLFNLPNTWNWCDLDYLIDEEDNFCYGVVQPGKDVSGQQKIIRVLDIKNDKILTEQLRGISWDIDKSYKRSKVKKGDLLVSIVGTIGRSAIVDSESEGFNIARAVAKVPISDISSSFVKIFIDSLYGQRWLVGDAREVARKTLNLNQLSTLPIPVPSNEEQQEIVSQVESLFALADKIDARYKTLKEKIDTIPQAILNKAFRGELVDRKKETLLYDVEDMIEETESLKAAERGGEYG